MALIFEDVVRELAASGAGRSCLIEVGQTVAENGDEIRIVDWSEGALAVAVGPGWVELRRVYGVKVGNSRLRVNATELRAFRATFLDFRGRAPELAEFFSVGQPYILHRYYRPPGKDGKPVKIGERRVNTWMFGAPSGVLDIVDLSEPIAIADQVSIVGEIWVRGEQHGPPEGSQIGLRYQVGPGISLDCDRSVARVFRGEDAISFCYETALIDALLEVLEEN